MQGLLLMLQDRISMQWPLMTIFLNQVYRLLMRMDRWLMMPITLVCNSSLLLFIVAHLIHLTVSVSFLLSYIRLLNSFLVYFTLVLSYLSILLLLWLLLICSYWLFGWWLQDAVVFIVVGVLPVVNCFRVHLLALLVLLYVDSTSDTQTFLT